MISHSSRLPPAGPHRTELIAIGAAVSVNLVLAIGIVTIKASRFDLLAATAILAVSCWTIAAVFRLLTERDRAAAREAALARLGRQLTGCTDHEQVRALAAECAIDLCSRTPNSVLLVLTPADDRLVLDIAIDADGVGEPPEPLQLPAQLPALLEAAENAVALDVDRGTAVALDAFAPAGAPRHWRAATVPGPWGTILLLVGAPSRLPDPVLDAFRILIAARALADRCVAADRELEHRAQIDQLTALPNRALFFREFAAAIEATAGGGEHRTALLMIDLDDFKQVNDVHGQGAGDELLIQIGDRISEFSGPDAIPGRFGDDEFALLLCDLADPDQAVQIADRLCRRLREPVLLRQGTVAVGASLGIAAGVAGQGGADLIRSADIALSGAKALGKNRVVRYDESVHGVVTELRGAEIRLTHALQRDEIVLFYQPILDPWTGTCQAVEATYRWHQPGVGMHDPVELTAIAERTGDIVRIGEYVLHTACRAVVGWDGAVLDGQPDRRLLRLYVKVSVQHLLTARFVQTVTEALAGAGMSADRLSLELLDPSRLADGQVMEVLLALRRIGVQIAVHFGTGEVPLADLRADAIQQLKLDADLLLRAGSAATFEIGVSIGRILGLAIVAERLRSTDQLPAEVALGQGPLYAEALAAPDVAGWIRAQTDTVRV